MKNYDETNIKAIGNDLYAEVDNQKLKNSCSLWMVYVLLAVVLVALLALLFWAKSGLKLPSGSFSRPAFHFGGTNSDNTPAVLSVADSKVQISEDDLAKLLVIDSDNFPLRKAELKITPDGIVIQGRTSNNPLSLRVSATFLPEIVDNELGMSLRGVSAGKIEAPSSITTKIGDRFSGLKYQLPGVNGQLSNPELHDGYLEIAVSEAK